MAAALAEFLGWVEAHKSLHPQASWEDFEDENGGIPDAYLGWHQWWRRQRVRVEEARALTLLIKEAPPAQRRDPDNHLYLLTRALKTLREEGGLAALDPDGDGAARAIGLAGGDPAVASEGCPDCGGSSGRACRRLVVTIGGGPERDLGIALGCLCPLGRLALARDRQAAPGTIDLAAWHSLWLRGPAHRSWPELPRPGLRRLLGGWTRRGVETRIVRCLDDVLCPAVPSAADRPF